MGLSELTGVGDDSQHSHLLCVQIHKDQPAPDGERIASGFFAFWFADWTTLQRATPPNGTRWQMGFGVMRSPVGPAPEAGKGSQGVALMDRPAQATDATAPEGRREATRQGWLCFAPQPLTKRQTMTTMHRAYLFYRLYRKSHNITESLRYAYQQTFGNPAF